MKKIKFFYSRKAFSLIELLVVVILIALLAGLAMPNLIKGRTYLELKQTAKDIAYMMQYAQQRSVLDNREYQIQFDSSAKQYWLMVEVPIDDAVVQEKEFKRFTGRIGKISAIPLSVALKTEKKIVCFYPNGLMDKIQIDLTDQKNKIVVSTKEQRGSVYVYEVEE